MRSFRIGLWLLAGLLPLGPLCARADEHGPRVPPLPRYQQECGACHVAFPARGLPAASWARLMAGLPQHFGTDASLDPAALREIDRWLQAQAASGRQASPPPEDRITRSAWFLREHDEVGAATWRRAAVGRPSNCAACHTGAAEGRFNEHELRIPR